MVLAAVLFPVVAAWILGTLVVLGAGAALLARATGGCGKRANACRVHLLMHTVVYPEVQPPPHPKCTRKRIPMMHRRCTPIAHPWLHLGPYPASRGYTPTNCTRNVPGEAYPGQRRPAPSAGVNSATASALNAAPARL